MNVKILNYKLQNDHPWMSRDDLSLVTKAMAMDLTHVVNWEKEGMDFKIFGVPMPQHYQAFSIEYWIDISSQIFYVGEPKKDDDGHYSLEIELDNLSICKIAEEMKS